MSRSSDEWQKGFEEFIQFTFGGTYKGETTPCPCARCHNMSYKTRCEVQSHLILREFDESFIQGEDHGEHSGEDNIDEGVGDEDVTHDGHAVRNLISTLIKGTIHGDITSDHEDVDANNRGAFDDVGNVCGSSSGARKNQEPNGCAKEFFKLLKEVKKELYPGCKEATKLSFIVRLFQIKCMLGFNNKALEAIQLFSLVRWHKEGRVTDGIMQHPAESLAWKHVDDMYPQFE